MIDKRLIHMMGSANKYLYLDVFFNWLCLLANMTIIFNIAWVLQTLVLDGTVATTGLTSVATLIFLALGIRFVSTLLASKMAYKASCNVKQMLREKIYQKLLGLGMGYNEQISTAEVVQVSVEGVEQLDFYFGRYLPQLFYSLLAPLTLFLVLSFIHLQTALVLLICVPLIPLAIVAVQKIAKKLLSKYWTSYSELGDNFLENLQGLTTLKIYETDALKHTEMNAQSEKFRKITMKVLTMQLNSVTIMDFIAYGGAAVGIILAVSALASGAVGLGGAFALIMLSAEFFIPLRLLGSFFHIAMNGMAASEKIFRLLDLEEPLKSGEALLAPPKCICFKDLSFGYENARKILDKLSFSVLKGQFTALVGESGCGKSTIAGLLMGILKTQSGRITLDDQPLDHLSEASIMENITLVTHNSMLFKGSVRDNLLMACPNAKDSVLIAALKRVNLYDFLLEQQGLDTPLLAQGANLSGGQCQRLAVARALLHPSEIYIFDEATSNIDAESEGQIMTVIHELAKEKTVILISHRLANVIPADQILVLEKGRIAEKGTHLQLLEKKGAYANLYLTQHSLENYRKDTLKNEAKTL